MNIFSMSVVESSRDKYEFGEMAVLLAEQQYVWTEIDP